LDKQKEVDQAQDRLDAAKDRREREKLKEELDALQGELEGLQYYQPYMVLCISAETTNNHQDDLSAWLGRGLLSLPREFVSKMSDAGFRWGGIYGNRKDYMHFELVNADGSSFIAADGPKQT